MCSHDTHMTHEKGNKVYVNRSYRALKVLWMLIWVSAACTWFLLPTISTHQQTKKQIQPARWPLLASPLARFACPARPKAVQTARQPAFALRALPLRNDRLHLCPASRLLAVPQTALAVLRYVFVGYVSVMAQPGSCNKT